MTVPIVHKDLPKLGSIGGPIATMAASALRSVGAQAAAAVNSDSKPSDSVPEGVPVHLTYLLGVKDRAILAEAALYGIMRLDKRVLKQHQVFDKMHAIIRPLAPTIQRADSMLSSIMQPSIAKVALASVIKANPSKDATQQMTSAPQTPAPKVESAYHKNAGGVKPKIGVKVDFPRTNSSRDDASPTQAETQDGKPVDKPIHALTEALVAANPGLEDALAGIVERGTQVNNDAFSNATTFGLPILLGNGKESEYEDQKDESVVAVTGLAQRAMLAEAALQVVLQLPTEIISSLEVPNVGPTLDAFDTEGDHDESDQEKEHPIQGKTALAALAVSAVGGVVTAAANTYLTRQKNKNDQELKIRDQQQKDQELALKRKEQEQKDNDQRIAKTGQNMTATAAGLEPPHKDVKHHDPETKAVIDPHGPPRGGEPQRSTTPNKSTVASSARPKKPVSREHPESLSAEDFVSGFAGI